MREPTNLMKKLAQRLFGDSEERDRFLDVLLHPKPFPGCILWRDARPAPLPFEVEPPLFWQPPFVDRLQPGQRPGQHPLHDQGAFYCLDFSSVFAASPLLTVAPPVDRLVDVCASPGGKSIFAWVALQPAQLLSNEVIGKRTAQLLSNLRRCRVTPAIVLRLDSQVLAAEIPQTADVVVVDAPCSGQSLIAKGGKAAGCFHPVTVNSNAKRQKRILANSAQVVAPQGHLLYSTCTYSPEENEQVVTWFLERFPQFEPVGVEFLAGFQSHLTEFPCYRMFPQTGLGAGAFTVLLRNREEGQRREVPLEFFESAGLTVL
jgi:16S rRNA C967 or C1407 C5-methylase (RsmB/RsmF family)